MIEDWILDNSNLEFKLSKKNKGNISTGEIILKELVQNGYGSERVNFTTIPLEGLYSLSTDDHFDKFIYELKLPPLYNEKILLKSDKENLNHPEMKITYTFHKFLNPPSENLNLVRDCCFLKKNKSIDQSYTLNFEIFELFNEIDRFNKRGLIELNEQFEMYGKVLNKLKNCKNVELDSSLINFSVELPEKFDINIEVIDNVPQIILELFKDKKMQDTFNSTSQKFNSNIYPLETEDNKRVFVPTNEKQHAEKIKKDEINKRLKSGEKLNQVLPNPIEYFDPETVNISEEYSERVVGFGLYEPKLKTFSSNDGNEWFPEFEISDSFNGTSNISFKTRDELKEFEDIFNIAKENREPVIEYNQRSIPLNTAEEIIERSKIQLSYPEVAIEKDNIKKYVLKIKENDQILEHVENITVNEIKHNLEKVPNFVEGIKLQPHQEEGVAWLQSLYNNSTSGCLLADDMGLGKTLQVLSFLEWLKESEDKITKNIIVAPLSLLENWKNEYGKFFIKNDKSYQLIILDSSSKGYLRNIKVESEKWDKNTIVVMNYATLRSNQIALGTIHWDTIVLDEAQQIKTPGTMITNAAKALNGNFKIAITGTPVENTYQDLWCLMDFTNPGLLGCRADFNNTFSENGLSTDEEYHELGKELRAKIGDLIKRRDKSMLKDVLGNKFISSNISDSHNFYIHTDTLKNDMEGLQIASYKSIIATLNQSDEKNVALSTIHKMKAISDHPRYPEEDIVQTIAYSNKKEIENYSLESARIKSIYPAIDEIRKRKEKVIIFAEYRITQHLLKLFLENRYQLNSLVIINGDTPATESQARLQQLTRQQHIDKFNESKGFNIIIMSPIAAGTGLNVTGANHVIHYSRHWNPAKENQATDRAYRIGQKKDVFVYYPLATSNEFDSFDVVLDKLLQKKNTVAGSALFPSKRMAVHQSDIMSGLNIG